ncbi:uncharacterized protein LOC129742643 [Uranotaenia lowii]|uniref:uncharacterized protein LOC129742643 n=1 Tax=Uranotaenia lowii TaxID=190385 RepID=UPI00247910E1|nr:uncharacterized protein LOC129742643 [Uranotaenia lowii]
MTRRNKNRATDETVSPDKLDDTNLKKQKIVAAAIEINNDDDRESTSDQGGPEITLLELHQMIKNDILNASSSTNIRIDNIAENINKSIEKLQHEVEEVKVSQQFISNEFEQMKVSLDDHKSIVSSMKNEIAELKNDQTENRQYIEELNFEVNMIKQSSMEGHLLISNVVQLINEDLVHLLNNILSSLGISCNSYDIIGITRLSSSNGRGLSPILVRFMNIALKDKIIRMARKKPLSCIDIGLNIDQRIYFNQRLTHLNQRLLGIARKFKTDHHYKFVWFSNGFVFLKKDEKSKALKITDIQDLPNHN